ncbi:Rab-GTPase-TBC domain containing protein [Parasponia andersonii]|uniref:Rab-GTPase-TBC domain containing protein n=1 Tax=Parasponia andersonii TaxID=3476 RepID=A0A2P5DLK6_PARAD|nr:Rab-GTPase-TBC domain containing protein [Parasponia andersonii]
MIPATIEPTLAESSAAVAAASSSDSNSSSRGSVDENRYFNGLRSVKWRINLGILPSSSSSSIDDLRRVMADSRRRYAGLRRHLLVDPHILKQENSSSDVVMDNPLSQNPDSTWGRFFRNAELEKMVDQDLSRLYPEHGSYFQTPGCQGMLRRILLLWCLRHSEFGYRQGMHELLAPLLYVLHVDVERLSHVRTLYEDHFTDKFDGLSFHDSDLTYNFDFKRSSDYTEDEIGSHENVSKARSLIELDPEIQTIILLSDAYGAEGELGIVISEKFMEHDAYCMFDALMSGANGSVTMAEFFSPSPAVESQSGLPPVIEASAALYHLLSFVDPSLHSHLVELGVEPQYFALRWFRVLFGREFSLGDLLIIWDEIFASENSKLDKSGEDDGGSSYVVLCSPRGAFISAMAVSMLLHLRSSLLATEHATSCLQRLLNFPESVDLKKLLQKAKSLQTLALNSNISSSSQYGGTYDRSKSMVVRGRSDSFDSISPKTPLNQVSVSYWEEKWRFHHREEELRQGSTKKQVPTQKKGWTEKVKLTLSRTESDPSPGKLVNSKKNPKSSVRRRLLEDLSRELGFEEDIDKVGSHEVSDDKEIVSVEVEDSREDSFCQDITCTTEDRCLSGNAGSEENSSIFSDPTSPHSGTNDHENDSEKSSVASNLSLDGNDDHAQSISEESPLPHSTSEESPLPISHSPKDVDQKSECKNDPIGNSVTEIKEKRPLSGKFQWFWKFGRNAATEETSEKGGNAEATKSANEERNQKTSALSAAESSANSSVCSKGDVIDQNVMGTLKNLGHSMLEHIQVIESVFQQDRGAQVGSLENFSKNILVGKGQVTATAALKELRKISNILSEM